MAVTPQAGRPRLVVDWTRCQARGLCAELLPEAVALDEWGYPVVDDQPLPSQLVRAPCVNRLVHLGIYCSPDQSSPDHAGASTEGFAVLVTSDSAAVIAPP